MTEKTFYLNWPVACVIIVLALCLSVGIVSIVHAIYDHKRQLIRLEQENEHWHTLAKQIEKGCGNPDNRYSIVQLQLSANEVWGCTPFNVPSGMRR